MLGSVVITDNGNYYLAIGKLILDDKEFLALSPTSPLGAQLMGCIAGNKITFLRKSILILAVE